MRPGTESSIVPLASVETGTTLEIGRMRDRIDEIDLEILALIEERMELGLRMRRFKRDITDAEREQVVLDRAARSSLALIEADFAEDLYGSITAESKRLQAADLRLVAFQGEHGAFSEIAARSLVCKSAYAPCTEFLEVFRGVDEDHYDLGVVPVENSLEGYISQVNDLLARTRLNVIGEAHVPIHHQLLASKNTALDDIRIVYSHPQALAQCHAFLQQGRLEARPYYDTAGAARMVARERPRATAAIASSLAAELYGLEVVKAGIEDEASNTTRFLLLSREAHPEGNKCSVVFATRHEAGSLFGILELFADSGINLTRIASMPDRTNPKNYCFFLDFEGSHRSPEILRILDALQARAVKYRFLGCYTAASRMSPEVTVPA
jgi:prephenate dehydratase/chorismate mutase